MSRMKSLGAGLAVADNMLLMLHDLQARDQGVLALEGYEFINASNNYAHVFGAVVDMGVTDRRRPQFLACQLANRVLAGDMVTTSHAGDDPTWSVSNMNRITFTNAHCLQSYALVHGESNAVIVFNLDRTNTLSVNFSGAKAPAGTVTWQQLTSGSVTNGNEFSVTVDISTQSLANYLPTQTLAIAPCSMNVFTWQEPALRITGLQPDHGGFRLAWVGGILATQYVESATGLTSPDQDWTAICTANPPTPTNNTCLDLRPPPAPAVFYRVRAQY